MNSIYKKDLMLPNKKDKAFRHYNIPIFIPELACPFQCVFCNQRNISGMLSVPEPNAIKDIIESHLETMPLESDIEIAFFGGNFTGIQIQLQQEFLSVTEEYISSGRVKAIRLSTRPDYITKENLLLLKRYNVKTIELGAQSLDKDVLRLSGRGHKVEDIIRSSKMILDEGFSLGLQMMIGLPGDSLEKSLFTAKEIVELGADNTRIYPTLVIKDTKLAQLYESGKYSPLSLQEATDWSKQILKVFEEGNVKVIRMGLHPSEGLISGEAFLAGPFHISFRELVLTETWNEILMPLLKMESEGIVIHVPIDEFNYAVGYESKNKKKLLENYRHVKFEADQKLKGRTFRAYFS